MAVSAQNPKGRFSVTPMAGINVTGLSGGTLDAYKYKVRMTAGAEAEYSVNDWLGLSLGAFYSQQGANIDWASAGTIIDAEGVLTRGLSPCAYEVLTRGLSPCASNHIDLWNKGKSGSGIYMSEDVWFWYIK